MYNASMASLKTTLNRQQWHKRQERLCRVTGSLPADKHGKKDFVTYSAAPQIGGQDNYPQFSRDVFTRTQVVFTLIEP